MSVVEHEPDPVAVTADPPEGAEEVLAYWSAVGATVVETSGTVATLVDATGATFLAAFLRYEDVDPRGMNELSDAVAGVLGGRRFHLHVRRALPIEFDPAPVVRAVSLWLGAIERGDWQGLNAVYDDGPVSVEISLFDKEPVASRPSGRLLLRPQATIEQLSTLDEAIMEAGLNVGGFGQPPVVCVVLGGSRPPRGYVQQFLYGTADWTSVVDGVRRVGVTSGGRSVFADPAVHGVGSVVWWDTPPRLWVNPWSRFGGFSPPGRYCRFAPGEDVGDEWLGRAQFVMCWGER